MSAAEAQAEELEVLQSIYDGDNSFREISPNTFQYKYGEDGEARSLLLEIKWPETYPDEVPLINLDVFYNTHIKTSLKDEIRSRLLEEAANFLGSAMTYSLFEWTKENLPAIFDSHPEQECADDIQGLQISDKAETGHEAESKKEKREVLTKAQKRRQWNRMDGKGERARGWNWVDVIKHLSQTGSSSQPS